MKTTWKLLSLAISTAMLSACGSSDSSESTTPPVEPPVTVTYEVVTTDASSEAAHLDLLSSAVVVDDTWHVAYQKYVGFKTNGGISGSGGVTACIAHQYDALFDEEGNAVTAEFAKLNIDNTQADFKAVSSETACLSATDDSDGFVADSLQAQIDTDTWMVPGSYPFAIVEGNGYIIRHHDGENYSRVTVTDFYMAPDHSSYAATLSVENWDSNAMQYSDTYTSEQLDLMSDTPYLNLTDNTLGDASSNWDIALISQGRSMTLVTNGGAAGSGDGATGLVGLESGSAHDVTDPSDVGFAEGKNILSYDSDKSAGALSGPGSYGALQYGADGGHGMLSTFTTYLLKDEQNLFKVQIIGNHGEDGGAASGNIVYRFEQLN